MYRLYSCLFFASIFFSSVVKAQPRDTLNTDSTIKVNALEEVEVQAMYSKIVTRRFPATVYATKINDDDILLPVNINESFNRVPSIYAHAGSFNTSRITMRGIGTRSLYGTRKINAMLNDVPLTSGEGDTFIDDIDLQFIDRMEIVGGPTAGIYGPALGGSILLYTKPAKSYNSIYITSGAGSYNTFQNSISVELVKRNSRLSLIYKNVHSDGYRQNNNYNRNSALLNYNFKAGRLGWNILGLFTDVKAGIPSSIDSMTFETDPRKAAVTWFKTKGRENTQRILLGITNQYQFSSLLSAFTTVYGLYKNSDEIRPFDILHEVDFSGGLKFHLKKEMQRIEGLTLTPGISVFKEKYRPSLFENIDAIGVKGSKTAENEEDIYHTNIFFIVEYSPNLKNFFSISFNVNKMGTADHNILRTTAKQEYKRPPNFSPRISVSHKLILNHFIFGSISHGLSYPSIQEILYPDGTINSNVRPENAWSFEMGLKGFKLLKEFKYSISIYYMPVNDLIVPDRIAEDTYIGKNIGKSLHTGLELSVTKAVPLNQSSWFYLYDYNFSLSWQSNKFKKFFQENLNLKNNELPGVPNKRMFISLLFKVNKSFFVEPEFYLNGRTAMDDQNTRYYEGYSISNLRFGYKMKKGHWNFQISSALNNLFDEKYASMILINAPSTNNRPPRYYYPGLPRNYYISVSAEVQI